MEKVSQNHNFSNEYFIWQESNPLIPYTFLSSLIFFCPNQNDPRAFIRLHFHGDFSERKDGQLSPSRLNGQNETRTKTEVQFAISFSPADLLIHK